jgi:hypothetical protein
MNSNSKVGMFLLNIFFGFLFFPLLLIAITWVTNSYWHNPYVTIVVSATGLIIYTLLRHYVLADEWSNKVAIRSALVACTAVAIWLRMIQEAGVNTNPWGTLGWSLFVCALLIVSVAFILQKRDKYNRRNVFLDCDYTTWKDFFLVVISTAMIAPIYLYWGTQYVWIPLVAVSIIFCITFNALANWDGVDISGNALHIAMLGLGIISTVCQFWFSTIMWGYKLWEILGNVGILIAGFIIVCLIYKYRRTAKDRREKIAKQKKADQERRQEDEGYRKKQEEKKKEMEKKVNELLPKILHEETADWNEILFLNEYGSVNGQQIPWIIIAGAPLIKLFEVSKMKNQIVWNGSKISNVFSILDQMFRYCFDDTVLAKSVEQIKALEKYSEYSGYGNLVNIIQTYTHIAKLVQLKPAEQKVPSIIE